MVEALPSEEVPEVRSTAMVVSGDVFLGLKQVLLLAYFWRYIFAEVSRGRGHETIGEGSRGPYRVRRKMSHGRQIPPLHHPRKQTRT